MTRLRITAFVLALGCALPSAAAEKSAPASGGQPAASGVDTDQTIKAESKQPMKMDEPMPTGMARKGMKKGDVKAHAKQKEAVMDKMMKQEEMKK